MAGSNPAEGEEDAHDEKRGRGNKGCGRKPGHACEGRADSQAGKREAAEKLAVHDPGGSAQEPGLL